MAGSFALVYNNKSYDKLGPYFAPGALVVTGRNNRNDPIFQQIRAAGGKVYFYIDVIESKPNNPTTSDLDYPFFSTVDYWQPSRANYPGFFLTDMRVGSACVQRALDYVESIMDTGLFDGVFLDAIGSRTTDRSTQRAH